MYRNLEVSRSGYHAWKARPQTESTKRNNALLYEKRADEVITNPFILFMYV
ncbi:hypothetical protein NBRC116188_16760 [Oceaniserpentilla sp. 4NH20-0058]